MNKFALKEPQSQPLAAPWLKPLKTSSLEYIVLAHTQHCLRRWGPKEAPLVILLHGWMDSSATFQFFVDACEHEWQFVALDWCGFGRSQHRYRYDHFDFVADLDALVDQLSPDQPVAIVAHSFGANMAMLLAASKPHRVRAVVNIEGFAPVPGQFDQGTPGDRLVAWMESQATKRRPQRYDSPQAFAEVLMRKNPKLTVPMATYIATEFVSATRDGKVELRADPRTYRLVPHYFSHETILELWAKITADVLFVLGTESFIYDAFKNEWGVLQERMEKVKRQASILVDQAAHNLQHDAPQLLAEEVESFLVALHLRESCVAS